MSRNAFLVVLHHNNLFFFIYAFKINISVIYVAYFVLIIITPKYFVVLKWIFGIFIMNQLILLKIYFQSMLYLGIMSGV